jgi:hypothetical protein
VPLARHYVTTRDSDHTARSAGTERGLCLPSSMRTPKTARASPTAGRGHAQANGAMEDGVMLFVARRLHSAAARLLRTPDGD